MLQIRRIRPSDAMSVAGDLLDKELSPREFSPSSNHADATWLGSEEALRLLGLAAGQAVEIEQLATVLRTSRAVFDLRFWAPSSVSWVWAMTDDTGLRATLEQAMVKAANYLLAYLVQNRPVVENKKPAETFAAALVLHVRAWRVPGEEMPPPQLHMHCLLVSVVDDQGQAWPANGDALFEETVTREVGAAGRLVLSEELVKLGFQIKTGTGYQRRYFEIQGVPEKMLNPDAWRQAICCE